MVYNENLADKENMVDANVNDMIEIASLIVLRSQRQKVARNKNE